jgi:signal transduction histidine kinase
VGAGLPAGAFRACPHLVPSADVQPRSQGCEECLATGDTWVHLRLCLECGHVGCCNESLNTHAARHHDRTGHSIIRSLEPGDDWVWCYVDQIYVRAGRETIGKDYIRRLPLFSDLSDADLEQLFGFTDLIYVPAGEAIMREGEPGSSMYLVLDGELEVSMRRGDRDVVLATRRNGEFVGEMALLERTPRSATVRTLRNSQLLVIRGYAFQALLERSSSAPLTMLRTMTSRLRSNQSLLMQQEKMAALGTIAAGLAHELNNPAAAISRAADHLQQAIRDWEQSAVAVSALRLRSETVAYVEDLVQKAARTERDLSNPLTRSNLEDEVGVWMEGRDIDRVWDIAPVLVAAGWTAKLLDELDGTLPPEGLAAVMPWLAARASVHELLVETRQSAEIISEIVKAVKTYSYLDQAPVQNVDIHQSLETTLVILRHKLKTGITVTRKYAPDLPTIEAYGSELNQVWTNLIDNAVDAMDGKGEIIIRTSQEGDDAVVEIEDTGPGIPLDVQPRVFEPFFTTKAVGSGTGLGLHIVYDIVVNRHHGEIGLVTRPGANCFRVALPIRLKGH